MRTYIRVSKHNRKIIITLQEHKKTSTRPAVRPQIEDILNSEHSTVTEL
jgi:hypothetical protein